MTRPWALVALVLIVGCETAPAPKRAAREPEDRTMFLGAFAFNVHNMRPVVIKECTRVKLSDAKDAVTSAVAVFENDQGFGMHCERGNDGLSSSCQNEKDGIIGRVDVFDDLGECMRRPRLATEGMQDLYNLR